MTTEIILPEMGEGVIEGTLSRWLVHEGQVVEQYEPVAELETDKVTTEISTEVGGTVLKLCVSEGTTVPVETVLAYIGAPGEVIADSDLAEISAEIANRRQSNVTPAQNGSPAQRPAYGGRISPVVGRIAAENHVDLALVPGTGRDGRVTKQDILAYIEQREEDLGHIAAESKDGLPAISESASSSADRAHTAPVILPGKDDKVLPLSGIRRAIAQHMVDSKRTSPHVTTIFEFDFTSVAAHRDAHKERFAQDGAKLTYTVYIVAAIVEAIKQHPMANSVWTDSGIILKRDINIGMATAVADGLIVPVIKRADSMNLLGLARQINDLADRARNKKLLPEEVQGGTFSLTNHGTSGSLFATPIINQPQAGILGIGKIEKRVKVINDAIAIRPLAFASFTFDHRILDGATADGFVSSIKQRIENW